MQILYELSGAPAVSGGTPFRDLTQSWYRKAVVWAYQNDVVSGTSGTTFSPEAPVTREQIGCIMMNYFFNVLKLKQQWALADLSEYPDGDQVSPWARASMQHAMSMIISGAEINGVVYIDPQGDATREQVATIVAEFLPVGVQCERPRSLPPVTYPLRGCGRPQPRFLHPSA